MTTQHLRYKYLKPQLLVVFALLLAGCQPGYYKANRVNAPLLSKKGQVAMALAPYNGQVAFSPINKVGIIGGYTVYNYKEPRVANEYVTFGEIGAGYYNNIDTPHKGKNSGWIYDIYGGYGRGRISINNAYGMHFTSMDVSRAFIQPGIGIRGRATEFAFNTRFCNLFYNNFNGPYDTYAPKEGSNYLFLDWSVTFRFGYKPIKFEIQYVNSNPLSSSYWRRSAGTLNVGLTAIIGGYK